VLLVVAVVEVLMLLLLVQEEQEEQVVVELEVLIQDLERLEQQIQVVAVVD
jgi:hypothetical protein